MPVKRECKHPCCGDTCRKDKPKKPRKRLNPISKKQGKRNREYAKERKEFLEDNPACQAQLKTCLGKSTQVHHKRGRVGKNFLDKKTWLACCQWCHDVIELNPELAKELGLSESRLT